MTSPVFYTGAIRPRWQPPPSAIPVSLKEKVIAWWEFDEINASDASVSSKSLLTSPLTATPPNLQATGGLNSTTNRISPGIYGLAAKVDVNTTRVLPQDFLRYVNNSPTTITIWHNRDTTAYDTGVASYRAILGRYYNSGSARQWSLTATQFTTGGPLKYAVLLSTNGTALTDTLEGPVYDRSVSGWDFIVITLNPIAGTVSIQINNGTVFSKTTTFPLSVTAPGNFGLGGYFQAGGSLGFNFNWKVSFDNLAIFDDTLTTDELTALYNSGAGLRYIDLSTTSKVDLVVGCTNRTVSTAGTSFPTAVPAGAAAGDTLLAILRCRGDYTFSVPAGWTSHIASVAPTTFPGNSGDTRVYVLSKAYAGETSVTFSLSGSFGVGIMLAVVRGTLGTPVMANSSVVNITKTANNSNLLVIGLNSETPAREPYSFGRHFSQALLKGYTGYQSGANFYFCAALETIIHMDAGAKVLRSSWQNGPYPAHNCTIAMETFPL